MKPNYRQIVPWVLYDFANAPFAAIVLTFVFSTFFTKFIAENEVQGTSMWGATLALSGILIGMFSPVFGAIADQSGRKKPWVFLFASIVIACTFILSFFGPETRPAIKVLFFVLLANCCYSYGQVFYNSMLIQVAPKEMIGRISGLGWGLGYFGGLVCLILTLCFLIPKVDDALLLELGVKKALWLVGAWFILFSFPLFIFYQEKKGQSISLSVVKSGLIQLKETIRSIREYKTLTGFLLAYFFYSDGITTLLNFGGIYAATVLGFSFSQVMAFAIAINLIAGLGAVLLGLVDDKIGPSKLIIFSLIVVTISSICVLAFQKALAFWIFGLIVGVFIGPLQSASRSMFAQIAPQEKITEMFGLYALTGKVSTFFGPLIISLIAYFFESKTLGMYVVVVMFTVGLLLMLKYFDFRFKRHWLFFWK
jgi:UMF1 family MFS transporter